MKDPKGQATTQTSYSNGYAYTTQQTGFNVFGESTGQVVEIPSGAPGSAMGTDFVFSSTYDRHQRHAAEQASPRPAAACPSRRSPTPRPPRWTCPAPSAA